jgi:hypothetical protein
MSSSSMARILHHACKVKKGSRDVVDTLLAR